MNVKDSPIDTFLEQLKIQDFDKYEILTRLRDIVLEMFPSVTETFKYGGIIFSLNDDFGGLFVSKKHVSFEFTYGYKLSSELKLEGKGKYRRHLKINTLNNTLDESVRVLLRQIENIDKDKKTS